MPASIVIVIPTKDRPSFVRACVQAACAGLPANGQIIVVDDHGALPAAKSLADIRDPRIKVVVNTGQRGPSAARNFGVSHATGDLILFVDDDDLLKDGYADYVSDLANTARYGFCATQSFKSEPANLPKFQPQTASVVATLPFKNQLAGLGCGFWIYRSDFIDLGGVDEALTVNEDTDFSIRLLAAGLTGVYERASGVLIRQHAANPAANDLGQITKRSNAGMRG